MSTSRRRKCLSRHQTLINRQKAQGARCSTVMVEFQTHSHPGRTNDISLYFKLSVIVILAVGPRIKIYNWNNQMQNLVAKIFDMSPLGTIIKQYVSSMVVQANREISRDL